MNDKFIASLFSARYTEQREMENKAMITASFKEIKAFCTTLDMATPRTIDAIIADLRSHYRMFWFERDKVQHVLEQ